MAREKFPKDLKKKIHDRDGWECKFPKDGGVCGCPFWLEVHHVKNRAQGGDHDPANLVTLCQVHHELLTDNRVRVDWTRFDFERGEWRTGDTKRA